MGEVEVGKRADMQSLVKDTSLLKFEHGTLIDRERLPCFALA